jgi:hypothetical protein
MLHNPYFVKNEALVLPRKYGAQTLGYFSNFQKKLPKVNDGQICENSHNPVALVTTHWVQFSEEEMLRDKR